jgi:hypothetical protein
MIQWTYSGCPYFDTRKTSSTMRSQKANHYLEYSYLVFQKADYANMRLGRWNNHGGIACEVMTLTYWVCCAKPVSHVRPEQGTHYPLRIMQQHCYKYGWSGQQNHRSDRVAGVLSCRLRDRVLPA